jgi:ribosome maturation factor RimP
MMNRGQLNNIIEIVSDALVETGYECIEAEWNGAERILRVYIDFIVESEDRKISVDDCVAANRIICNLDEIDNFFPGPYHLEVSSPGIERPLRFQKHFERYVGGLVKVNLFDKVGNRAKGQGKIVEVSPAGEVTLETQEGNWVFPLQSVKKAHLVYQ